MPLAVERSNGESLLFEVIELNAFGTFAVSVMCCTLVALKPLRCGVSAAAAMICCLTLAQWVAQGERMGGTFDGVNGGFA